MLTELLAMLMKFTPDARSRSYKSQTDRPPRQPVLSSSSPPGPRWC